MNSRERLLATIVTLLLVVVAGLFAWDRVSGMLRMRYSQIETLRRDIQDHHARQRIAENGKVRLTSYEARSLPTQRELAHSLYQEWLLQLIKQAGLNVNLEARSRRSGSDVYEQLGFHMNGTLSLEQLTQFLYRFYSVDFLHRISAMTVKTTDATRELHVDMDLQALLLLSAEERTELSQAAGQRLTHDDVSQYVSGICARDIFALPNAAPQFKPVEEQSAQREQLFSLDVSATDDDPAAKLTYALGDDAPEGAEIDAQSGAFRWTPTEAGTFDITLTVADNGSPPLTAQTAFKVVVAQPAESQEEPQELARVSGFVDGNRPMVWIRLQPSGKTIYLGEGDQFEAHGKQGTIEQIGEREVQLIFDGESLKLSMGEALNPPVVASD